MTSKSGVEKDNQQVPKLFHPPIIALVLLLISVFLHFVFPINKFIYFPYSLTGVLLIVLGFKILIWGKFTFQRKGVELIPGSKSSNLIEDGPFKFTRNPMYLGFVLILVGISFIFGSISAFLAPIVFFLIIHFSFIPFEEKHMEKQFGKGYLDYKKRVRKWV